MNWLKNSLPQAPHLLRGEQAEAASLRFLRGQRMKLVEKNFRCPQGEIDLIMRDSKALVFVEIRYRGNPNFGDGADSVGFRKQRKLINAANVYLQSNPATQPCRFDVVAVSRDHKDHWQFRWIKNAFQEMS